MTAIVVHYKELSLKGRNRAWFVQMLVRNIKAALKGLPAGPVRSTVGRIEIELGRAAISDEDRNEIRARLSRVFGIANFSFAKHGPHDFRALADAILQDAGHLKPESFRVAVTRTDKRLPFLSPQAEREIGGYIKQATGWHVNLGH